MLVGKSRRRVVRLGVERLEDRWVPDADPAVLAYQARSQQVIDGNLTALRSWATTNAAVADNASPGKLSMWTAAAGFSRAATDPAALAAARKLAAGVLEQKLVNPTNRTTNRAAGTTYGPLSIYPFDCPYAGGNDGWPVWAAADTRVRFDALIESDPGRYRPTGYAANPAAADGKYSLDELFKIVLTQSYYAPIDSTSNHYLMNATGRFLAEMAYPGQVVIPFNRSTTDTFGANHLISRAQGIATTGPGEYGSPNYGADNWGEFLSLMQLTDPTVGATPAAVTLFTTVQQESAVAYGASLAYFGAFDMNGQLAMPTARGYPSTGAWGVAAGDVLSWVYFGGDFGYSSINATVTDTGEKTLGVLGAVGQLGGYTPPAGILHLDDPAPRITQTRFGNSLQYSYLTANYGHSSESMKFTGGGSKQTHWNSRVVWTKPYDQDYNATAWVQNVAVNATLDANGIPQPTLDSAGNPVSVDPFTLQAYGLYGSGTYGVTPFEDFTQDRDTVLHVVNVPPRDKTGTPGGTMPTRGSLIYLPIPRVKNAAGQWVTATTDYIAPQLSADARRLYVAYGSVFIAFTSSTPIATPRASDIVQGNKQFFRIYGGPNRDQQTDPAQYIQFAVAVQTASPADYPGTTLAERFANFKNAMMLRQPPAMTVVDTLHPVWQYSDGRVTLSNTYMGDTYHGGNDGRGQDWVGGPNNENPRVIDYNQWPMLRTQFLAGGPPVVDQPNGGNLSVNYPGTPSALYDFQANTLTTGANVNLSAVSDAAATVRLSWTGGVGQTGWLVERSTDGTTWVTAAANLPAATTGFADGGLTQGAWYWHRVTPLGTALGPSAPTKVAVDFAAPTNLRVQAVSTTSVKLTWTNAAVGAANTRIQWTEEGSEQWTTLTTQAATATSYTATGQPANGRRFYRVLAVNSVATSDPSNVAGTELTAGYFPVTLSMPRYLTAAGVSAGRVDLQWVDTGLNETGYQVERSADGGTTWTALTTSLPANSTAFTDTTVTAGVGYRYRVAARSGAVASAPSNVAATVAAAPNQPPTVAQGVTGTVVVTGTTGGYSVLGADDGGEPGLTYHWQVTSGPGATTFAPNNSNPAKATTATFTRAGTYQLLVTIVDAAGRSVVAGVQVVVAQTPTALSVTPGSTRVRVGLTRSFSATATGPDQFGNPITSLAGLTWQVTAGSGVVAADGLYTAPAAPGLATVRATLGGATATAAVTVTPAPAVTSTGVDDGTAQRSMVRSLTVTFSMPVGLAAGAFTLTTAAGAAVPGVVVGFASTTVNGVTVATVSFSGTAVVGGSLPDGRYILTVNSAAVSDTTTPGSIMTADQTLSVFRLFGDVTGDGFVDGADLAAFRRAYGTAAGQPGFSVAFDFNGDGFVDGTDLAAFRRRFGTGI